jgi:hypothetical protein
MQKTKEISLFSNRYCGLLTLLFSLVVTAVVFPLDSAGARQIEYYGGEAKVYVTPGEPTVVSFPGEINGGYKRTSSDITMNVQGRDLIILARPGLSDRGEVLVVYLKDNRSFMLRVIMASE